MLNKTTIGVISTKNLSVCSCETLGYWLQSVGDYKQYYSYTLGLLFCIEIHCKVFFLQT